MNPDLLRDSWRQVKGAGPDAVAGWFYGVLAVERPDLRRLFGADMREQRVKLVGTLDLVARSARNLDGVVPVLQRLGRAHRRYGVDPEDYAPVGRALLATLEHFLGDAWTPQLADTWAAAYDAVSRIMIRAAARPDQPGTRVPAVQ